MVNYGRVFLIIWLTSLTSFVAAEVADACSVHPTAAVVVVGEKVSLHCTASREFSIRSWQIGPDVSTNTVVYVAPVFGPNGTVRTNESVADGYHVTNATENNTELQIKNATLSQAGLYVCQCHDKTLSAAQTAVVVLASEPNISISFNDNIWKTFNVNCVISFNGSADISSELTIKDISGVTDSRTVCPPTKGLMSCNLTQTITANASTDQSYRCLVNLIRENSTIYSKIVNTSLEWKRVSRVEIVVTNPDKCSAEQCAIGEKIMCQTDGHPGITVFEWRQILNNGNESRTVGSDSQSLVLNETGHFTYQCLAYNVIRGEKHSSRSKNLTIAVTENKHLREKLPAMLVIGISLAIGVIVVFIFVIVVICIARSRKQKKRPSFRSLTTEDSSAIPQRPPANRYNKTPVQNPLEPMVVPNASSHPAVSKEKNSSFGNDLVVFENDLYEGARYEPPKSIAQPDDGVIYNEIGNLD